MLKRVVQTVRASATVEASIAIQSRLKQQGTTPAAGICYSAVRVLIRYLGKQRLTVPRVGLKPIMLLNAAGTRPEPAVSVANENET